MRKYIRNRTFLGSVSIVIALIIAFVLAPIINKNASNNEKIKVVVVAEDILKDELITEDMIQELEVVDYNLSDDVIISKKVVVDKYATTDIFEGSYITHKHIVDELVTKQDEYLYEINSGKKAMSITVQDYAKGLSGKLVQGDLVTIYATGFSDDNDTIAPVELSYVEVLAVTSSLGEDKTMTNNLEDDVATVTFLLTSRQAEILADLEVNSTIHLALAYRGEDEKETFLKYQNEILQGNNEEVEDSNE